MLKRLLQKHIRPHAFEKHAESLTHAVSLRRDFYSIFHNTILDKLPYLNYKYEETYGKSIENCIGYVPVPVGICGPIKVNNEESLIPIATTEGALCASISRGMKALNESGGVTAIAFEKGMTRSPLVKLQSITKVEELKQWIQANHDQLVAEFSTTTKYGKLTKIDFFQNGCYLHVRFTANCGEALGMNMISKGCEHVMNYIMDQFGKQHVELLSLSSNMCTDKKQNTINNILGRSKHVVLEANIPSLVIENTLKTDVDKLINLNVQKNFVGSGMAGGTSSSFNAHTGNMVAGVFIATGQDPAQVTTSSSCIVNFDKTKHGVQMTCTMPAMEVATIGGGTSLSPQRSMLEMMGIYKHPEPKLRLASLIGATVMAGELSLMSAHTSSHLVSAHMNLGRK